MATNITTAASTFTTANMKPAANDQADALWAQNIGDNLGHLYYRREILPIGNANNAAPISTLFYKRASHNYIRVCFASNVLIGSSTVTLSVFASTSDWGNFGAADATAATVSSAITINADVANSLELDISGLTNGGLYYARMSTNTGISSAHPAGFFLIHGITATY